MTPAERLRKNQRMLDKAIRELDQTRTKLEKQEKTLVQQIKTSAKNGQMNACKIQAKDLVRKRRYIEKFFAMRSQLQKISLRLQVFICDFRARIHFRVCLQDWQTYRTNEQMMQAMKGATMALGSMNKSMNLPQLQRIAMEFERENDIMEQRQEMMDDAVDDAMDVGVEEEGDEVIEQVLEEIGVDFNQAVRTNRQRTSPVDNALTFSPSSERHRQRWEIQLPPRRESRKPSVAAAGAAIPWMTTCKPG